MSMFFEYHEARRLGESYAQPTPFGPLHGAEAEAARRQAAQIERQRLARAVADAAPRG